MNKLKFRDRNYILDKNGFIWKIVGDYHESDFIIGYIKYFPSKNGTKVFQGKKYEVNTQVFKSYYLAATLEDNIRFSHNIGTCVTGVKKDHILEVYDTREKIKYILKHKEKYKNTEVGRVLTDFLDLLIKKNVNVDKLGVTGSFLTDMFNNSSDIDLVCFGEETYNLLKRIFKETKEIKKYTGKNFIKLYKRRMTHMPTISPSILKIQENRKIQGIYQGVHVNIQPLRDDDQLLSSPPRYIEIGDISIFGKVKNDRESVYAPAYYDIYNVKIIDGYKSAYIEKNIKKIISFIGAYSQIIKRNESFFAKGTLLKASDGKKSFFVLSIDPWNRGFDNKLQIIK